MRASARSRSRVASCVKEGGRGQGSCIEEGLNNELSDRPLPRSCERRTSAASSAWTARATATDSACDGGEGEGIHNVEPESSQHARRLLCPAPRTCLSESRREDAAATKAWAHTGTWRRCPRSGVSAAAREAARCRIASSVAGQVLDASAPEAARLPAAAQGSAARPSPSPSPRSMYRSTSTAKWPVPGTTT